MAINIAKAVNNPNNIVGIKFDKHNTEKPNAIVKEVVIIAFPTLLFVSSIAISILLYIFLFYT